MKIFFSQVNTNSETVEEDLYRLDLKASIRKTRQAMEINALQKRYQHLTDLAAALPREQENSLYQHSPIRALVSHVFG